MIKIENKINVFFFNNCELFSLVFLFIFFKEIPFYFGIGYGIILFIIFFVKIFIPKSEKTKNNSTLLSVSLLLSEISLIFITYSYGTIELYYYIIYAFCIIGFNILFYTADKISYYLNIDSNTLKKFFVISGIILLAVGWIISSSDENSHRSIEVFKLANVLFMIGAGVEFLPENFDKYKKGEKAGRIILHLLLVFASIVCVFLCAKEIGSCMVIILSDIFFMIIYALGIRKRFISVLLILILAVLFLVYLIVFNNSNLRDLIISHYPKLKNPMIRLFFLYSSSDQIIVLYNIVFDKDTDKMQFVEMILKMFTAPEYREILPHEQDKFTSSADYLFSIFYYANPLFGILVFTLSVIMTSWSIIRSKNKVYSIIPIMLLVQSLIHIGGNMLVFPFTGITYPFLSYGKISLFISFIMIFIFVLCQKDKRENFNIR